MCKAQGLILKRSIKIKCLGTIHSCGETDKAADEGQVNALRRHGHREPKKQSKGGVT